jgi:hypothetical protein
VDSRRCVSSRSLVYNVKYDVDCRGGGGGAYSQPRLPSAHVSVCELHSGLLGERVSNNDSLQSLPCLMTRGID